MLNPDSRPQLSWSPVAVEHVGRVRRNASSREISRRGLRLLVVLLLAIQAGLLVYSATRHSPTLLEPAFLVSGISHWQFGRFELYRVNPPLVRLVAALPVLAAGCNTDWSRFYESPGSRAEFPLGEDFIKANGLASIPLVFYARWACVPFSLIGAFFAYRWAKELYGEGAGLVTLILYVFEPNLLAHGELITPDAACTAFGILAGYTFWRWLQAPTWTRALLAGGALGLAQLSKLSWLILFGLWPLLWLAWRFGARTERTVDSLASNESPPDAADQDCLKPSDIPPNPAGTIPSPRCAAPGIAQFATIIIVSIYLINLGYGFDAIGTRLGDFEFVSRALTGSEKSGTPGNRFRDTWLEGLPVLLPRQYVLGFDSQKKDFESYGEPSYLRGEWKQGGWWYYYLYALVVKVPCGTWGLFALVILLRLTHRVRPILLRDELVLLTPAVALLALISSQTEFNHHLRYALPCLGLGLIFLGQVSGTSLRR